MKFSYLFPCHFKIIDSKMNFAYNRIQSIGENYISEAGSIDKSFALIYLSLGQ